MKRIRATGGHDITIRGRRLNINLAKIIYVCQVCHGKLTRRDFGLVCTARPEHRGFIHRDAARAIRQKQKANQNELSQFYEIKNGKVVLKCQSMD